jgi:hypothetical protein
MSRFTSFRVLALCALGLAGVARASTVGYTLDVTTEYLTANPAGTTFLGGGGASPDTGYFVITNNGTTTFSGIISDIAVSLLHDDSFTSGSLTLAPGQSVSVAIGAESSNGGGYNGPFGSPQPGVQINIVGQMDGTEAVNLSVLDSNIHSGVFRINPFGETLDNYVLQGGDSTGRDTGDGYEETQAFGHFEFFEASPAVQGVPLPASAWGGLLLLGVVGLNALRARKQHA